MKQITRPEMCELIPQGKKGIAEIRHYNITKQEAGQPPILYARSKT